MMNQAELNFYGYNPQNIIQRGTRGRVSCVCRYDGLTKQYIITRKTPRTTWTERTADRQKAINIYFDFIYEPIENLENLVRLGRLGK